MRRPIEEAPSSFPKWVALACLAFGLWQFFANTLPAVQERQVLRNLATDLVTLRQQYDDAILQTRLGVGENAKYDLQAVLVAIDQQGYTPAELCAAYPCREPGPDRESGSARKTGPAANDEESR